MYETAPPPPPPPPVPESAPASRPPGRKFPLAHLIFAALLLLFVCGGYIPSMDPPKADLKTEIRMPRDASAETAAKIDEENKKIREENQKRQEELAEDLREWNDGGQERMEKWIFFCKTLALLTAVLWVIYTVYTSVLKPLLRFISTSVGPEFAALLTPLIILALLSVLSQLLLNVTRLIGDRTGVMAALLQYPKLIIENFCIAIQSFAAEVLHGWVIGAAYLLVIIYMVLKKYFRPRY